MLFQSSPKHCAMKKCLQFIVLLLLAIAVAVSARAPPRQGDEDIKPIFWRTEAARQAHELRQLEETDAASKPSVGALLSHEEEEEEQEPHRQDVAVEERAIAVAAEAEAEPEKRDDAPVDGVPVKLHDLKVGLGQLQDFAPPLVDVKLHDENNVLTLSGPRQPDEQHEGKERHAPVHVEIFLENKVDEQPEAPRSDVAEQPEAPQSGVEDERTDEQTEGAPSGADSDGEQPAKQEQIPQEQPAVGNAPPPTNQSSSGPVENRRSDVGQRLPIVETDPRATFEVMYNADNPARCTVTRLQLLHPGETAILPNECGRIRCLDRSGTVSIVRCPEPEGPPPANCQLVDPVTPRPLFPKCCERNLACS